jgi:hypothetical protein
MQCFVSVAGFLHDNVGKNSERIVGSDSEAALTVESIDAVEDDLFVQIVEKPNEFLFDIGNLQR